jgi:uncharacterized phage protein (TIGR02220 family)
MKANHKDGKWRGANIPAGSFVTGRKVLATETGMTEQQVRTAINRLKSTNEITIKTTNKYSIIAVNNWSMYQGDNQQPNQQSTNKQPATNQQLTTNKNDKKKKNTIPDDFLERFNTVTGRNYRVITDKTAGQFNARIKEGFTIDEMLSAAENASNSDYHQKHKQYLSPEFITRADKLQMWGNKTGSYHFIANGKNFEGEDLCNGLNRKQHIEKYGRVS